MPGPSYDRLARRQLGLVTGAQLERLGWTEKQVRHAVAKGLLHRMRRGVFRVAGAPPSREQTWLAAALAAPGTFLCQLTAAAALAVPTFPTPRGIDLLRQGSRPRLDGVVGHRTLDLPPSHVIVRRGLPMTSAARTVIDSCGIVTPRQLSSGVNDLLRRRALTLPRLVRTVDEVPVSGRRAIVPVVELLAARLPGYDPGDSDPEVDLVDLLVGTGFPRPQQQVRVTDSLGVLFVDVGWPELRVGFEYDSVAFHQHRFHEDRDRLRRLKRAGWDIWPITSTTSRNEIVAIAHTAFGHERVA